MTDLFQPLLAVTENVVEPSNVGVGAVVLTVVAGAFLAWVGYLVLNSRRRSKRVEETPHNLQPYLSDGELESTRVTRVLNSAVVAAAVLALVMPVYYINESGRQESAADKFHEKDIEEGERWYNFFSCINCHGPEGSGGAAPFVEARSDLDVAWSAPSLNDVYLRFSDEEIETWIVFGRDGTPMPGNGLEGGGAMTGQEVDQVMAYLRSIQISQGEALDEVEGLVNGALARIQDGEANVARLIAIQQAQLDDTQTAQERFDVIEDFPDEVRFLMAGDGTCTDESASAVGSNCGREGTDTDRDGLTDEVEVRITEIGSIVEKTVLIRLVVDQTDTDGAPVLDEEGKRIAETILIQNPDAPNLYGLNLDPANAFTGTDLTGEPVADLHRATTFLLDLETAHLTLSVTSNRLDTFVAGVANGLEFLEASFDNRNWDIDYNQVAADGGLTVDEARRAAGLYNAYCARCHTGGYQAGVAYEQVPGSGAWGPSLLDGRAVIQFPDEADHMRFIVTGSEANVNYGINGLGSGRMPGFGQILSVEDIELLVAFERTL